MAGDCSQESDWIGTVKMNIGGAAWYAQCPYLADNIRDRNALGALVEKPV